MLKLLALNNHFLFVFPFFCPIRGGGLIQSVELADNAAYAASIKYGKPPSHGFTSRQQQEEEDDYEPVVPEDGSYEPINIPA